jgi:endoglucanase
MTPELAHGINFGNSLEAPTEGEWGMVLEERFFDLVKAVGFSTVRLPVRWSAHALPAAPFTIDPDFLARIDWAIRCATERGLFLVLDLHHYEELMKDTASHRARFLGLWEHVAEHYASMPSSVLFELCNEPFDIPPDAWNEILGEAIAVVRRTNRDRTIVVSGVESSSIAAMRRLALPRGDRRLIATFHYYLPFRFTHQDAYWVAGSEAWLGTHWTGTEAEKRSITSDLDAAARWGEQNGVDVWLGEFGAYSHADMESRVRWTTFVAREAERRSIHWAYWEFGAGFGIYDRTIGEWRDPLLRALI